VQTDHPEEGCDPDSGFSRGDAGPGKVFGCLEKLDIGLDRIDLPPLSEWEESEDTPGQYHYSRSEDRAGGRITDDEYRANPDLELFLVDYTISVSVAETRPLTAKDVRERVIDG
jgi:hypothetical protein